MAEPLKFDDDDVTEEHEILKMVAAAPGWVACFGDDGGYITYPVCTFCLVKIVETIDGEPCTFQSIRPYVATPEGDIDDALKFENYICLSGPGEDANIRLADVKRERAKK